MGYLALTAAVVGCIAAGLPNPGMFVAMAAGLLALATGWVGYRRPADGGWARLAGAGAICLGLACLALAGGRYALTLAALRRLEALL